MERKKILFISHEASLTGAPILLLRLLRWMKDNTHIPFCTLLRKGGTLKKEFEQIGQVVNYEEYIKANKLLQKISKKLGFNESYQKLRNKRLLNKLLDLDIAIIYSNTVTNGPMLELLSCLECPVISHVHELEYDIQCYTGEKSFSKVKENTNHFIAVSKAVRNNLLSHGIENANIEIVYGFVEEALIKENNKKDNNQVIRNALNIKHDEMIVGATGTLDWRKGPDIFLQLAKKIVKNCGDLSIQFVWMGGDKSGTEYERILYDLRKLKLEKNVHFIGKKEKPMDYFKIFDVFTLVSREDPFPLVCLEAASVCKPIVCFRDAGGMDEFVENDCGFVVNYLDIDTMAQKVLHLLKSEELREKLGKNAMKKVSENHHINIVAPKIIKTIERMMLNNVS